MPLALPGSRLLQADYWAARERGAGRKAGSRHHLQIPTA